MKNIDYDESLKLILPKKFLEECSENFVAPETVIRGFIADFSCLNEEGYITNGSDERWMADDYFQRCGYGINREACETELLEKGFQLTVEKIRNELKSEEQYYIQDDLINLAYEALEEAYPAAKYHPFQDDFAEEIMNRVRLTEVFSRVPEFWPEEE